MGASYQIPEFEVIRRPERCTACGACACVCPAHIRLVQTMQRARQALPAQEERQA